MAVNDLFAAKGSMFKWDTKSRFEVADARESDEEKHWREICAYVTAREKHKCRYCRRRTNPNASTLLGRGHHHHIVYRSAGGEDSKENVCLLCARCHDAEHVKKSLHISGNAEETLTFSLRDEEGAWYISAVETSPGIVERD